MIKCYAVALTEYSAGWGQCPGGVAIFSTYEKATAYSIKFNSRNTEATAPDWYIVAGKPFRTDFDACAKESKWTDSQIVEWKLTHETNNT